MKSKLTVVIIGAGSATFGGGTIADLTACPELRETDLEIRLVDVDAAALERTRKLAALIGAHFASPARITATTDRSEALPGTDYVITSVARRRWDLWEKDYYLPLAYGFRRAMGENGGPGRRSTRYGASI